jgi:hypothetical protein
MPVMAIGRLAAARLAVLPFAPLLWPYAWWLVSFVRRRVPQSMRGPVGPVAGGVGIGAALFAQADVYTRMTGIWAVANDNYFLGVILVEIAIMVLVVFLWTRREQSKEKAASAG